MVKYNNQKNYYDTKAINTITSSIANCQYENAIKLADKYIEQYPNDIIVHLLKAKAMVFSGLAKDAVELAKSWYEHGSFHNEKVRLYATSLFCDILKEAKVFKEAEKVYKSVIAEYKGRQVTDDILRFINNYLAFLLNVSSYNIIKYDDIIEFVKNNPEYDNDDIRLKHAQALVHKNHPYLALKVLDTIRSQDSQNLHKNFTYGFAYYKLANNNHFKREYLEESESYYLKSLNRKNYHYYHACYDLASIYARMGRLDKAVEYVDHAKNCLKILHLDESFVDALLALEFSIYLAAHNIKKCEEITEKMDNKYVRIKHKVRLLFAKGDYRECILEADKILENGFWDASNTDEYNTILYNKICSLVRLKEYAKARECLYSNNTFRKLNSVLAGIVAIGLGEESGVSTSYIINQLIDYDREATIKHIFDCSKFTSRNKYDGTEEIAKAVEYAENSLTDSECYHDGILDVYHVDTNEFGLINNERGDTLIVKTLGDTLKVVSAYPIIKYNKGNYIEEYVVKKELKRESQIDKFNRRYGTN